MEHHLTLKVSIQYFIMPEIKQGMSFLLDKYNMFNLAHNYRGFNIEASWSFSATGHGKGPCDGLGAVVKSTATQHLLRGGPNASFSSAKDFFEWCLTKNDQMVVTRPFPKQGLNSAFTQLPESNRPIEVLWLPTDLVNESFEIILMPRWKSLSAKGNILKLRLFPIIIVSCRFYCWNSQYSSI